MRVHSLQHLPRHLPQHRHSYLRLLQRGLLATAWALGMLASPLASADVSKEACLDAHSRGQDAKDQGKITLARKLFLTCAQSGCPSLVQGDCARFADDLGRMQPTLSFVARDGSGRDLFDTTVHVDDVLVATRLDDGKSYDVDPGKHTVKFSNGGKEQVVTVVVGAGEKGRTVNATFEAAGGAVTGTADLQRDPGKSRGADPGPVRPFGAKLLIGGGAVLAVGGGVLAIVGRTRVPSNCAIGTHQCAAPPGDPSFDKASSAVSLMNVGLIVAGTGVAALAGGFVWYVTGAKAPKERNMVAPWFHPGAGAGGLAVSGRL
jgi:hypothetical protein